MSLKFRLRLSGMQGRCNPHQVKNGFRQHAGWIFAHPVHHDRETQLMQQNSQQRRQVSLLARTVVAGNDDRHRFGNGRRQAKGMVLHRLIKAQHFCLTFPFNTQRNQYAAHLKVRYVAV
ncbi:hypothetical protein D3C73_1142670 [compost metagenome]